MHPAAGTAAFLLQDRVEESGHCSRRERADGGVYVQYRPGSTARDGREWTGQAVFLISTAQDTA